jgi:hypothetical protein
MMGNYFFFFFFFLTSLLELHPSPHQHHRWLQHRTCGVINNVTTAAAESRGLLHLNVLYKYKCIQHKAYIFKTFFECYGALWFLIYQVIINNYYILPNQIKYDNGTYVYKPQYDPNIIVTPHRIICRTTNRKYIFIRTKK